MPCESTFTAAQARSLGRNELLDPLPPAAHPIRPSGVHPLAHLLAQVRLPRSTPINCACMTSAVPWLHSSRVPSACRHTRRVTPKPADQHMSPACITTSRSACAPLRPFNHHIYAVFLHASWLCWRACSVDTSMPRAQQERNRRLSHSKTRSNADVMYLGTGLGASSYCASSRLFVSFPSS